MRNKLLSFGLLMLVGVLSSALSAQYTPPTYTNPGASSASGDYTAQYQIDTATPFDSGAIADRAADFLYHAGYGATFVGGSSYTLTLQNGPSWDATVAMFIDANSDGDYDDAGESLGTGTYAPGGTTTVSITIPIVAATQSTTRFRFVHVFDSSATVATASGTYDFGQSEEYDAVISFVPSAPTITSTAGTAAYVGLAYSYTVTATGVPAPSFSIAGTIPSWLTWDTVDTLSGTPAAGDIGTAGPFTITATTGTTPDDTEVFSILVSTPQPEMDVSRGATPIANGGADAIAIPSYAAIATELTYTIDNTGFLLLNFSGTPIVAQSNAVNCAAVIVDPTTNPIAALGSDTFSVTITPGTADPWRIDISIDNDDANENPYYFTISGTATDIYSTTIPFFEGFESTTSNVLTQITGNFPNITLGTVNYTSDSRVQLGTVTGSTQTPNTGTGQAGVDFGVPTGGTVAAGAIDFHFDLSAFNAASDTFLFTFMLADNDDEESVEDG
ncbi:MAG: GEVED domain-containing protein, partial [Planctomycetota bacterium]